jgi:acetyl esterase/lipase
MVSAAVRRDTVRKEKTLVWVLLILVVVLAVTVFYLRGGNLSQYDLPPGQSFDLGHEPSEGHDAVLASLELGMSSMRKAPMKQRLGMMREYMDNMSTGLEFAGTITPADASGVPAEWVQAPGSDPSRRVLYIHGGAFTMGSPRSHRNITHRFSEVSGAAVLAIDYRLMPESNRMAGVEDCRTAYRWLLENGPDGPGDAVRVCVAGDSAGGNLTLSLIAWIRDAGLRAPDTAVALSPATDMTLGSPSLKSNMETDAMLAPMFRGLARVPRPLLWWAVWLQTRVSPSNPVLSPVFGDLSNLPPTLVHASEAELLLDDARRYVNRAVAAGSPAKLQTWANMVHVWHMFYPQLQEARDAWDEIGRFLADNG